MKYGVAQVYMRILLNLLNGADKFLTDRITSWNPRPFFQAFLEHNKWFPSTHEINKIITSIAILSICMINEGAIERYRDIYPSLPVVRRVSMYTFNQLKQIWYFEDLFKMSTITNK